MGIPVQGVLAGYTNGTITTFDYTVDLQVISEQLDILNLNILAINANLTLISSSLSIPAAEVPFSIANSLRGINNGINGLFGGSDDANNKASQMAMLVRGLAGSVDAMSSAIHEQVAVQTLQVADQIENNAFQKQATLDALARNNLPAPQPPAPLDTIKEKVVNAEIIHGEGYLTGTVSNITDNVIAKLSNYILTSGPVIYAEGLVSDAWNYVSSGIKNTINDLLPSSLKAGANSAQRELNQAGINAPNETT
jgi:hypothetical protein